MKISRCFLIFLSFMCIQLFAFAQPKLETRIFLVRHAEKSTQDPNDPDPALTKQGEKRAKKLTKKWKNIKIDAVYSSNFKRTKMTALPTAHRFDKQVNTYNHKNLKELVSLIQTNHKGQNILVVGHSNSVLETLKILGVQPSIDQIKEHQYHFFFEVQIYEDGSIQLIEKKYGKVSKD